MANILGVVDENAETQDTEKVDKFSFLVYSIISDRVADTCEACNLKRAPAGAFLLRRNFLWRENHF